jgi:hypothetical protein
MILLNILGGLILLSLIAFFLASIKLLIHYLLDYPMEPHLILHFSLFNFGAALLFYFGISILSSIHSFIGLPLYVLLVMGLDYVFFYSKYYDMDSIWKYIKYMIFTYLAMGGIMYIIILILIRILLNWPFYEAFL